MSKDICSKCNEQSVNMDGVCEYCGNGGPCENCVELQDDIEALEAKLAEAVKVLKLYAGHKGADWGLRDDGLLAVGFLKKWGVE